MLPLKRLKKHNTIENLWIYILSLAEKAPVYGYELQKIIFEKFGFKPGKITSYRVLYRLEDGGFVRGEKKEKRKIYKITNKGKKELQKAKEFYKGLLKTI